jgi:hypothetical protein
VSDLILYTSEDGQTRLQLRADGKTIWLTQLEIADLFQTTKHNVSIHTKNIFKDGELALEATVKESLTVQMEGGREVNRRIQFYNLDLILAIGYRVRSPRGTQFRQWATTHLREFIVKGFLMDDERLKNPGGWDHFDELLARIREIRASEKRFYQRVRDLFALSSDYKVREQDTMPSTKTAALPKRSRRMPTISSRSRTWKRNSMRPTPEPCHGLRMSQITSIHPLGLRHLCPGRRFHEIERAWYAAHVGAGQP